MTGSEKPKNTGKQRNKREKNWQVAVLSQISTGAGIQG
jgi:hypothetical protein